MDGTTFPGWYITFQQAVLAALPRPPKIDQNTGLSWAGNGESLTKVLADALLPKQLAYPADGEVFELTLDGDASENDPIEMVRRDGYGNPKLWKYTGKRVIGKQTRFFKLVRVDHCRNLDEVRERLAKCGEVLQGQWREAFKVAYPEPDGRGPVGIADPSWVNPNGLAYFPCVDTGGSSYFYWADYDFHEHWRWLVGVSK